MDSSILKKVSKNVRKFREARGITQERFAELTDIDYKYVQKIEGKNPPNLTLRSVEKIAKVLKIDPFKLIK